MRGYFAIGSERISKAMNLGAMIRTAHAFGASFAFSIGSPLNRRELEMADTSHASMSLPFHQWASVADMALPDGCRLVGVELIDDAVDLPSFRHPLQAAYVLGPERGSLSPALLDRCDFVVKLPTKFCLNLSIAAALVIYDRMISLGRHAERPVRAGGPADDTTRPLVIAGRRI